MLARLVRVRVRVGIRVRIRVGIRVMVMVRVRVRLRVLARLLLEHARRAHERRGALAQRAEHAAAAPQACPAVGRPRLRRGPVEAQLRTLVRLDCPRREPNE